MNDKFLAGRDALRSSRLREAQELLQAALAQEPDNVQIRTDLGWAYYRANDFARAASTIEGLPGWEPAVAKLRSFGDHHPYQMRGPRQTMLPFLLTDPLPVVQVGVEGVDVFTLIDTGGWELLLDTEFAVEIGATLFDGTEGRFAGGRSAPFVHGRVEHVTLGEIEVGRVPVSVLPTRRFSPVTGGRFRIDGIIGTNLLAQFRSTLDYPAERLVLERHGEEASLDGVQVPFITIGSHVILADGSLNGVEPLKFFVDSGLGGGAFTCPERTLKAAGIPVPKTAYRGDSVGGGGGPVPTGVFQIDELGLGPLRQQNLTGIYFERVADAPEPEWDGIISHGFLRKYRWTIDFARSVFIFA